MTDITDDDEREAREWLKRKVDYGVGANYARTILALLDRPTLPRPEDVPLSVWDDMARTYDNSHSGGKYAMKSAYEHALYDHYAQPPAPKPLGWAVLDAVIDHPAPVLFHNKQNAIDFSNKYGGRIVRLVEDRDGR